MGTLLQDIRFAVRALAKNPGFTVATVVTLALGIGANTAVFSVINGVLIQPLPYQHDSQLMQLQQHRRGAGGTGFSPKELDDLRAQSATFKDFVEYHSLNFTLLGQGAPERVLSGVVTWNFFQMLGVEPYIGRLFLEQDDILTAEPVLLLSYRFWQSNFGGDPSVVGESVRMNDKVHTIVGVLPPFPHYPRDNDVYMPTLACPFRPNWVPRRQARALQVFGRVKEGVTTELASADVSAVANRMRSDFPEDYPVEPGAHDVTSVRLKTQLTQGARPTLLILMGTVGLVLLIAGANVANLMLARLFHREREMAVRAALGAGKKRLTRQLVTESTLLAVIGGVIGTVMAMGGLELLVDFTARFTPRAREIEIDGAVLLFTLVVSVGTGLLFGLLPALPGGRDLGSALRDAGGRASGGRSKIRIRNALVVSQLALSFMLLIGAGLSLRSFAKLSSVEAGVNSDNVLTMTLAAAFANNVQPLEFTEAFIRDAMAYPGVESVALASTFPLDQATPFANNFTIEGGEAVEQSLQPQADFRIVSPGYFEAVGQDVLIGRTFSNLERGPETPPVALISQALARAYFGSEEAIGKRIQVSFLGADQWVEIVGVVSDVRQQLAAELRPEMYFNKLQFPSAFNRLLIRTAGDPMAFVEPMRAIVRNLAPDVPIADVRTLAEVRRESIASPRLTALLLGVFGAVALVISATGIAGVIGFSVSQRTNEIGLRMALGAHQGTVLTMILRQGMKLVIVGLALGAIGAFALARVMSGLLFGIEATDPVTFIGVGVVLASVAAAATLMPARRATTIDPMMALRAD